LILVDHEVKINEAHYRNETSDLKQVLHLSAGQCPSAHSA